MKIKFLFLFVFLVQIGLSQRTHTTHQTFEISQEIKNLVFDFQEESEIVFWSANAVLFEKTIKLFDISDGLFKNLINSDRYQIAIKEEEGNMLFYRETSTNIAIKNQQGNILEEGIFFKIYLPDDFKEVRKGFFEKKNL